ALKLIDEGRLRLDDKIIDFIPELTNSERENVLVRHLLTHTLDWGFRLSGEKGKKPEDIFNTLFTAEFRHKPGEKYFYSNATSVLLGKVVERVYGKPLDVLGERMFFSPLQMRYTTFHPLKMFRKEDIVPTEIQEWRGSSEPIQGEIHDESAYSLLEPVGSAGVFSCCSDLLNFLEMFLNGGEWKGIKYFSPEIMKEIQTNQISDIGECAGLGWELNRFWMGKNRNKKTFGKTGFTGCSFICDIEREVGWVILSNRVYPRRLEDSEGINKLRIGVADIIFENVFPQQK
ncbi:MAG: serine hydrolase, partial [Candidatus Colwellbacteria bacterium]|nr:serine hydrolase [Candidatus Colwellbacteria bacterium]